MNCIENPFTGKKIGFFSLSGIADRERIEQAQKYLNKWGIIPFIPETEKNIRYLEGTDAERLRCFNELLATPELEMLVALRGGFGVTRILDSMDWDTMRRRNLPIMGYSDVSALHLAAMNHGCRRHIHGPMLLSQLGTEPSTEDERQNLNETLNSMRECLTGNPFPMLPNTNITIIKEGTATGQIVPCNLSMLVSLLGTPHAPALKNTILALEDIGEAAYRVDRMLAQLKSAGILKSLRGLAFGDFTDCEDENYLPEIFGEYAQCVNGPVISGLPFGHGKRTMSIKVGAFVTIEAKDGRTAVKAAALERFTPEMFLRDKDTMGYRLMRSLNMVPGKKYPLILFLHGAGERGEDNTAQLVHVLPWLAEQNAAGNLEAFVAAPQCPALKQWVDTPWSLPCHTMPEKMSVPMSMAMDLVDELSETLPVDKSRICIMGISMGGYGTWDAIQRFPGKFAAAVPICGGGDTAQAPALINTPIWAFHGELDNLVPTNRTTDMIEAIENAGGNPRMTIYPGVYHDSWTNVTREPELLNWLPL